MIKKISAAAALAVCTAALTAAAASAQSPIGRAANGVIGAGEDIINGVSDAGEDIANGITGRTDGQNNANTGSGTASTPETTTSTPSTGTSGTAGTTSSDANSGLEPGSDINGNQSPSTGVSFGLTAAAAVLGALGVVVTANRRGE